MTSNWVDSQQQTATFSALSNNASGNDGTASIRTLSEEPEPNVDPLLNIRGNEPPSALYAPSPTSPAIPEGISISRYEIIRKLGHGGMGSVFLARDLRLGRLVAVKLLHHHGQSTARLLAEAQATARAKHDNIVDIYDVGMADERPYMILEYLEGQTLREVLSKAKSGVGRPIPRGLALDIVTSVVSALSAAHENGILHGDLKPENIMLLDSGQVKMLDFGLARNINAEQTSSTGGTRAYMAPEQWRGEELDARADIWAIGIVMFELFSGSHPLAPFTNDRLATIAYPDLPLPHLRDVCPEIGNIAEIVDRCLRKARPERFASPRALLEALEPHLLQSDSPSTAQEESPFAGLAAFQESDASRFFGRHRETTRMLGWLRRHAFAAVVGVSGTGKSSFVRAGVIPALKRSGDRWEAWVVRPGRTPLRALQETLGPEATDINLLVEPGRFGALLRARCLARGAFHRIVVFVDQFEELFTLGATSDEKNAFLASLAGAADDETSPLRVIVALRSDFWDRLAEHRGFADRAREGLFFLPRVGPEGLREALVRPLERTGYRFEGDSMIEVIVNELSQSKIPLPLLQFAALALWEARDQEKRLITKSSHETLGGVAGALSAHAEAIVARLSPNEQRLCRAIVLRLVTSERTRALATLAELEGIGADKAAIDALVQTLALARLVSIDIPEEKEIGQVNIHIELVHESLIERWPTLIRWLDESAGDAHFRSRLRAAAKQWQNEGQPSGLLWRDRAAAEARAWYEQHATTKNIDSEWVGAVEQDYLQAIISFHERSRRFRRISIVGSFAFLSLVSILVFFLAWRAREQAKRADEEAARVRERNERLALEALKGRNATRIMAARKADDDPTAMLAVLREIESSVIPRDWPDLVSGTLIAGVAKAQRRVSELPIYGAAFSPDGTKIALGVDDGTTRIVDAQDLADIRSLEKHDRHVWGVSWSPDGQWLLTASGDNTARLWNSNGSGEPMVLRGHEQALNSAQMNADGTLVVTASDDHTARIWKSVDGTQVRVLHHDSDVLFATFSPDGKRIATTTADGLIHLWKTNGSGPPMELRGHEDQVIAVAFHPSGSRIATASKDKTVRVWDVSRGAELISLRGHEDKVMSVAWSPDGQRIASASKDMTARIWNGEGRGDPIVLRGHRHWVYSASFSCDGRSLVTTSLDRTTRLWNIAEVVHPVVLRGHTEVVSGLQFSPNRRHVATSAKNGMIRISAIDGSGEEIVLQGNKIPLGQPRWSLDGTAIVGASENQVAHLFFTNRPEDAIELVGHTRVVKEASWDTNGEQIVTISYDGTARLWNRRGQEIGRLERPVTRDYIDPSIRVSPKTPWVAIFDAQNDLVHVWNTNDPTQTRILGPHESPILWVDWNSDGCQIATVTAHGLVRIWPVDSFGSPSLVPTSGKVTHLHFSPDDQRLGVAHDDGTITVMPLNGQTSPITIGHSGNLITEFSWSSDGQRILTSHENAFFRIWPADGVGEPFVYRGSGARVIAASWSPDGLNIGAQSDEYVARIWPVVKPLSGPDDPRLWKISSYCPTPAWRMDHLGITEEEANQQMKQCEERVARFRNDPTSN